MGIIYQSLCSSCGAKSRFAGACLAIRIDDSESSEAPTGGSRLVRLPHPGEAARLKGLGYTLDGAAREARLSRFYPVLCSDCGTRFEKQEFVPPNSALLGCVGIGCVAGCVTVAVGRYWSNGLVALVVFSLTIYVASKFWERIVKMRNKRVYADAIAAVDATGLCPKCESERSIPANSQISNHVCPSCGEQAQAISPIGRS